MSLRANQVAFLLLSVLHLVSASASSPACSSDPGSSCEASDDFSGPETEAAAQARFEASVTELTDLNYMALARPRNAVVLVYAEWCCRAQFNTWRRLAESYEEHLPEGVLVARMRVDLHKATPPAASLRAAAARATWSPRS